MKCPLTRWIVWCYNHGTKIEKGRNSMKKVKLVFVVFVPFGLGKDRTDKC